MFGGWTMPAYFFRSEPGAAELRRLARRESGRVCQRVLMIANMLEGMEHEEAARLLAPPGLVLIAIQVLRKRRLRRRIGLRVARTRCQPTQLDPMQQPVGARQTGGIGFAPLRPEHREGLLMEERAVPVNATPQSLTLGYRISAHIPGLTGRW